MSGPNSPGPSKSNKRDFSSTSNSQNGPKKHILTPLEQQRQQLSKLLVDPSKPVYIPPPSARSDEPKPLRPPRELIKNVQGSSAGAGSGEFHVYKQSRRREMERLKEMERMDEKEKERIEFETRQAALKEANESRTAKKRAKRLKKRQRRDRGKSSEGPDGKSKEGQGDESDEEEDEEPEDKGGDRKRRMVDPTSRGVTFRSARDREEEEVSENEEGGGGGEGEGGVGAEDRTVPVVQDAPVAVEVGLHIVDDD